MGRRLVTFLGVGVIGFLVSALLLWLMVDFIPISSIVSNLITLISKLVTVPNYFLQKLSTNTADAKIAKLLTLPVVVIIQFSMNRRITFRENLRQQSK